MKTHRTSPAKRGFTLMELMVAMAITTIIVTVLVSITSIALDTWNRSRAELRAARQGKTMVDSMARDFEALVTRRGNTNEWLSAITATTLPGKKLISTNACDLIFFTAATDRYDGQIGTATDKGGDVSCAAYGLKYTDPIEGTSGKFDTFVLNRLLVNPDDTFNDLLGKPDLTAAFTTYSTKLSKPENFVCENIYQFSLTFHVQVAKVSGSGTTATTTLIDVPITVGDSASTKEFRIQGSGLVADSSVKLPASVVIADLKAGRLTAVEISLTVVSDFGIDQLRTRSDLTGAKQAEFLAKNSYQYTKLVQVPSM
ncbi:MAG: prepilin-type N-terminal cleavage/methylation domain-containing protein [Luteolibacter sp.]